MHIFPQSKNKNKKTYTQGPNLITRLFTASSRTFLKETGFKKIKSAHDSREQIQ